MCSSARTAWSIPDAVPDEHAPVVAQGDLVTFGGANSLDNYFARKDDAVDWLLWSDEASAVTSGYWKTIDTVLMGRRT